MQNKDLEQNSAPSLATAFYQGRIQEVLRRTVDQPEVIDYGPDFCVVLGALSFSGRVEEAAIRFEQKREQLNPEQQAAALFYLGVGSARLSQYQQARRYFANNLRLVKQSRSPRALFFAWQGYAFYLHLNGRKQRAMVIAQKALFQAIAADFFFGRMIATELFGHALVGVGQIARGLRELETAYDLAQSLGHDTYEKTIYRAITMYKVRHGLLPQDSIETLQELIQGARLANNYSDNALVLDLIRQLMLRGRIAEARAWHRGLSRSIYAQRHRRHEIFWHLHDADLSWFEGRTADCEQAINRALNTIDPEIDQGLLLHARGIKARLSPESELLPCRQLTQRLSSGIGLRMLDRWEGRPSQATRGEDPLGDLLDELADERLNRQQKLERVLDTPYLGLLHKVFPLREHGHAIHILLPHRLLLLHYEGTVTLADSGGSLKTLELLKALAQGLCRKEELVEAIWGYTYHPFKHDALLYSLISRVRSQLGTAASWIDNNGEGYQLEPGVRIFFHDLRPARAEPLPRPEEQFTPGPAAPNFNARQLEILDLLKTRRWVAIEDCVQNFGVSKVTATRDLTQLFQDGYLKRVGKGRATRYELSSPPFEHED